MERCKILHCLIFKCKFVFTLYAKALMVMMIARIAAVERSSGIAINIGLVLIFGSDESGFASSFGSVGAKF